MKSGRNDRCNFEASAFHQQSFLMPTLAEQLDRRQPLCKLADGIPWEVFGKKFGAYYTILHKGLVRFSAR